MAARTKKTRVPVYRGKNLDMVAFPLGGIGAGMVCIEGNGALSQLSVRNSPDFFNEPYAFSALCVKGAKNTALVLEGPVPDWKIFGQLDSCEGRPDNAYGLPRFSSASFSSRFPFAEIKLSDKKIPLSVSINAWSPFIPGDADDSGLPAAALEFTFANPTRKRLEAVYSFNSKNFMASGSGVRYIAPAAKNGFVLAQEGAPEKPEEQGYFCAAIDDRDTKVDLAWFRGGWYDPQTCAWKNVAEGKAVSRGAVPDTEEPSPGASIFVPFALDPGEQKTIRLMLSWYVPVSALREGKTPDSECGCCADPAKKPSTYKPWYTSKFNGIAAVENYWRANYAALREKTVKFTECFYDTSLPEEAVNAVSANLSILKSPTVLRQPDGKLWAWEGCRDKKGCCTGSCTHVWNYAQALPHLFPGLERTLRQTEFNENQDGRGHQAFRAQLPIRPAGHDFHAAADGQLGGIIKVYREWRISGDTPWLKEFWPKAKKSLDYCIETWDPDREGILKEPHHNTYDIEFWGPDGMCTSFYLGALACAIEMGKALNEDTGAYNTLFEKGKKYLETELFNGEYFFQKIVWKGLRADPMKTLPKINSSQKQLPGEALELLKKEGPKYQYGRGCLSDGILGAWMSAVCGLPQEILDAKKSKDHLRSIFRYNFKKDLSGHANPQRPGFALKKDGGLLLCSWPKGGELTLPFVYSNEVWTGIEYQAASHMIMLGLVKEGLEVVKTCRKRYDGSVRNPFDEYECGHWYARAMASYALIQALTGIRYDAVEKILYFKPVLKGDFRSFICTDGGYGTAGILKGKPFIEVKEGNIPVNSIKYIK